MHSEVVLSLSLARLYGSHANFAGTPRQAIADGYSAIDAAFTALLRQAKLRQPRNHKHKLDLVKDNFPGVFDAATVKTQTGTLHIPGTNWQSLEDYYKEWLASRYEDFKMGSAVASSRVREALNVVNAAIRHVAAGVGIAEEEFERRVATRAMDSTSPKSRSLSAMRTNSYLRMQRLQGRPPAPGSVPSWRPRRTIATWT